METWKNKHSDVIENVRHKKCLKINLLNIGFKYKRMINGKNLLILH